MFLQEKGTKKVPATGVELEYTSENRLNTSFFGESNQESNQNLQRGKCNDGLCRKCSADALFLFVESAQ